MNTSGQSIATRAHLIIMALTLVVICVASISRFNQIAKDPSYTWFGYAPASIQPVLPLDYQIPEPQNDIHANLANTPAI